MLATTIAALPPLPQLVQGALILAGAGLLRGFTGYGFSIAAVPLLSLVCPPVTAVALTLVLQGLISAEGLPEAARLCDWRSVRLLALGAVLMTPFGVLALTHLPEAWVRLCIAAAVAVATLVIGSTRASGRVASGGWVVASGAAAGLFNGLAGMPGPPVIAFYLAAPIASARARASMIVLFLLTSLAALMPLGLAGSLTWRLVALAVAAWPLVLAGSWAGAQLYARSSEQLYRWTGLGVLAATAAVTAAKAFAMLA